MTRAAVSRRPGSAILRTPAVPSSLVTAKVGVPAPPSSHRSAVNPQSRHTARTEVTKCSVDARTSRSEMASRRSASAIASSIASGFTPEGYRAASWRTLPFRAAAGRGRLPLRRSLAPDGCRDVGAFGLEAFVPASVEATTFALASGWPAARVLSVRHIGTAGPGGQRRVTAARPPPSAAP